MSGESTGRRWVLKHLLFVLGGITIGVGFSGAVMPEDPNMVAALGTAVVGLLALVVGHLGGGSCIGAERDA